MTLSDSAWISVVDRLSVTCAVKLLVHVAVGVPVMVPVEVLRLRPVGRDPVVTDQV